MEGFSKKQLEQLRALFAEERLQTSQIIAESEQRLCDQIYEFIDDRFITERQYTKAILQDSEDRLSVEVRDANQQRKEDDDIILEKISLVETRVEALELSKR
jgi:hypothetical protein